MEIKCSERELSVWQDSLQEKRSSFSQECVVPDSQGDIARILWTRGGLLLKGKELGPGSLCISGEAWAWVLYRNEEGKTESLRLRRSFSQDFELPEPDGDALPQMSWTLERAEARALNPRKLSVNFSVRGNLRSFRRGNLCLETLIPEEPAGLHLLRETREALAVTGVWEKPFSLREQFSLPAGKSAPLRPDWYDLSFDKLSLEQIGSRAILKAELHLEICGQDRDGLPVSCDFRLPFSQLLETGEGDSALWQARIEPCAVSLDWIDGPGGECSLDAEIRALAQLTLWTRASVTALTDAYSSRMPCSARSEARTLTRQIRRGSTLLRAEERLPLPEDFGELLSWAPSWENPVLEGGQLRLGLMLELLYRRKDGAVDSRRWELSLSGDAPEEGSVLLFLRPGETELRREEDALSLRAAAEQDWEIREEEGLVCVTAITLDQERTWDPSSLPAVYLVRRGSESIWELARRYRADPAAIEAANPKGGELLLIPCESFS